MTRIKNLAGLILIAATVSGFIGAGGTPAQTGPDPAEDDYYYARGLDRKGHTDLAIQEYKKFLARHRGHRRTADVLYLLGLAAHKTEDYSLGETTLKRLQDQHPDFEFRAEALFRRGDCLFELKRFKEAAECYGAAAADGGKDGYLAGRGLYWQGESLFRADDYQGSVGVLTRLEKEHGNSKRLKEGLLTLAYAHYRLRDYLAATAVFDKVLKRYATGDHVPEALYWKGTALLQAGKPEEAASTLEQFLERYRTHRRRLAALEGLGWARHQCRDLRGAAEAYEQLAGETSGAASAKPWLQAAKARYQADDFAAARRHGARVLELGGALAAEGGYIAALAAVATKDDAGAVGFCHGALAARPTGALEARILVQAAGALHRLGRLPEAAASYELASKSPGIGPLAAHAVYHAGLVYHEAGDLDRADQRFKTVIEKYPNDPLALEARFATAENAYKAGDYPRAVGLYNRYLEQLGRSRGADGQESGRRSDACFKLGCAAYHAGDRAAAAEAFRRHLKLTPSSPLVAEARYYLGLALQDLKQWKAARAAFARCAKDEPRSRFAGRALLALGKLDAAIGRDDDALESFKRLQQAYPASELGASARFGTAQVLIRRGDRETAVKELETALNRTSDPDLKARIQLSLARVLLDLDRHEEAAAHARKVLDMEGGTLHPEALELVGYARLEGGDAKQAERAFSRFLKQYPRHELAAIVALNRGIALSRLDRHQEAVQALEVLRRAHPAFPRLDHVVYHLALEQEAVGKPDDMVATFRDLLEHHPGSALVPEVRFRLGEVLYARKRYAEAVPEYAAVNRASNADEDLRAKARYKEGWALFKARRMPAAAAAFDRLAGEHEKSSLRGEAMFQAGLAWMKGGKPGEALDRFSAMVKAYPQHQLRPRAEVRAGECCLALEKWPEAVRWFTTARARPKLDKVDLPVVDHGLGVGYQMTGRYDSAIQAFQRVAGQYEGARAAECQFRIAQCRAAQGDTSGAVGAYLKVSILHEHPEWVPRSLFEAASLCLKAGQTARAAKVFKELVKDHPDSPWALQAKKRLAAIASSRKQ